MESDKNINIKESAIEPTQIKVDFLNQDIDTLSPKDLAKYLITLIQERDSLFKNNSEKFSSLTDKIKQIYSRYNALKKSGALSPKTQKILSQIKTTIESIHAGNIEKTGYEKLQYELTEAQIDEATSDMESALNHDATLITIGVGKYEQAGQSNLSGTIPDVNAVNEKLTKYNSTRKSTLIDENATKENILKTIGNSPKNKSIFLYFSGHGIDGHIAPYTKDAIITDNNINKNTLISPKELFDAIGSRKAIVILDKCYGGDAALAAPDNITVISATDSNKEAGEGQINDNNKINKNIRLAKEEKISYNSNGEKISRGYATYGFTDTSENLNLRGFIQNAHNKNQSPVINTSN